MSPAELICRLAVCPDSIHEVKPMDLDRGPIPTQSIVLENLFILAVATVPLVVQGWAYAIYPRELAVVEDFRRILTPRVLHRVPLARSFCLRLLPRLLFGVRGRPHASAQLQVVHDTLGDQEELTRIDKTTA